MSDLTNSSVHWIENRIASGTTVATPAAIASLTDNTGGTASDTLADVPGAYTEATLANQLASITAKVNGILAALRTLGIIAT
jgi:hypothetical protein